MFLYNETIVLFLANSFLSEGVGVGVTSGMYRAWCMYRKSDGSNAVVCVQRAAGLGFKAPRRGWLVNSVRNKRWAVEYYLMFNVVRGVYV